MTTRHCRMHRWGAKLIAVEPRLPGSPCAGRFTVCWPVGWVRCMLAWAVQGISYRPDSDQPTRLASVDLLDKLGDTGHPGWDAAADEAAEHPRRW